MITSPVYFELYESPSLAQSVMLRNVSGRGVTVTSVYLAQMLDNGRILPILNQSFHIFLTHGAGVALSLSSYSLTKSMYVDVTMRELNMDTRIHSTVLHGIYDEEAGCHVLRNPHL